MYNDQPIDIHTCGPREAITPVDDHSALEISPSGVYLVGLDPVTCVAGLYQLDISDRFV